MQRNWIGVIGLLLCLGVVRAAETKPNVVLIMADDFGYECVGANGGESYRTPHLDQLAASGIRFEQCHVQPLCTPTRVELMTGRYNVRNYFRFGILPAGETTFAQLLKEAGYATGICGKWQLGRDVKLPQKLGFDESFLWQHTRRPPRYANTGLEHNGVERDYTAGEYGPKLVNDFALDFITRHQDRPFFLYYPMMLTHDPFQPTPDSDDWDPAAMGEGVNRDVKHFADMTTYADKMVGRLVGRLEELGLRERTLVIFLGDNGTGRGVTSRWKGQEYQGGKGTTTRHGTHVPCIASWPGVIEAGRVNRDLIGSVDFLPTICQAADAAVPANVDGVSFLPQLKGEPGKPREWLYTWYSPRLRPNMLVREFAFNREYKLYRSGELYKVSADPLEERPLDQGTLSDEAAAAAARLQKVLDQFAEARPLELDRAYEQALRDNPPKQKGKRQKGKGQKGKKKQ